MVILLVVPLLCRLGNEAITGVPCENIEGARYPHRFNFFTNYKLQKLLNNMNHRYPNFEKLALKYKKALIRIKDFDITNIDYTNPSELAKQALSSEEEYIVHDIEIGSIVEVLSLNGYQIDELTRKLPEHEKLFTIKSIIGMRYKIGQISEDGSVVWMDVNGETDTFKNIMFYTNQLRLC